MTLKVKNICCIGAGYVGGPSMAVLAYKCPSLIVNVVDTNEDRINAWNNKDLAKLPIFEPGLEEIIKDCRNKNLFFSSKIKKNIAKADLIFISVNTPTKQKGLGAGKASDLKWVEACARQVAKFAEAHTIVVEKSTLPVRTAEVIKSILNDKQIKQKSNSTFDILSNPEFLSEGTAIEDLLKPDRVLIGGEEDKAIETLSLIYREWVTEEKIIKTNIWSSELAKLTANAFLAQRISSINSISALCERTGANVREVARAIGSDKRIGPRFLNSGPGFGGSCFKKDILNLVYLAEHFGLKEVADFWEAVIKLNNWHQNRIAKIIVKKLFGTICNKKLGILGFAFKANTNDTRESSAITICRELLLEGAHLNIYDPKVKPEQIEKDLEVKQNLTRKNSDFEGSWTFKDNIQSCTDEVDAVIIMTEWDEFKFIDWKEVSLKMRSPSWIFDTRSIINIEEVKKHNLNLWCVGYGD